MRRCLIPLIAAALASAEETPPPAGQGIFTLISDHRNRWQEMLAGVRELAADHPDALTARREEDGALPLHLAATLPDRRLLTWLLERTDTPDPTDARGRTPLHLAAAAGREESAAALLAAGADSSRADEQGRTALDLAIDRIDPEIVGVLLEAGAAPARGAGRGNHPLALVLWRRAALLAAQRREQRERRDGDPPSRDPPSGEGPAGGGEEPEPEDPRTARLRRLGAIRDLLLAHGADPQAVDWNDLPCLHAAAAAGDLESLDELLAAGADPKAFGPRNRTLLDAAVRSGLPAVVAWASARLPDAQPPAQAMIHVDDPAAVAAFVAQGVPIDGRDDDGRTRLHRAAARGELDMATALIAAGADLDATFSHDGWLVLHSDPAVAPRRERAPGGVTPLFAATDKRQFAVAEMLIEAGADVTLADHDGETPLHLAAQAGRVELVESLLERGADPAATTSAKARRPTGGRTPLHYACHYNFGRPEVAAALLAAGCPLAAEDTEGATAYVLAGACGNRKMMAFLAERGADTSAVDQDLIRAREAWDGFGEEGFFELVEARPDLLGEAELVFFMLSRRREDRMLEAVPLLPDPDLRGNLGGRRGVPTLTLLQAAIRHRQWRVVRALVERGADVTSARTDERGRVRSSVLTDLISGLGESTRGERALPDDVRHAEERRRRRERDAEHRALIELVLAAGADPDGHPEEGERPLAAALRAALPPALVGALLEAGASFDLRGKCGKTPLDCIYCYRPHDPANLALLLEAGADPDAHGRQRESLLVRAARQPDPTGLRLLLAHGATVDLPGARHGATALMTAAALGRSENLRLLLEAGADPRGRDNRAWTPLHYAEGAVCGKHVDREANRRCVDLLRAAGARPTGITTAMWRCQRAFADGKAKPVLDLLAEQRLDFGAWPSVLDDPAGGAYRTGNADLLARVLALGADPDAASAAGTTVLMRAARDGAADMVDVLLEAGADRSRTDDRGRTAADYARLNGHRKLAARLLPAAAPVPPPDIDF